MVTGVTFLTLFGLVLGLPHNVLGYQRWIPKPKGSTVSGWYHNFHLDDAGLVKTFLKHSNNL